MIRKRNEDGLEDLRFLVDETLLNETASCPPPSPCLCSSRENVSKPIQLKFLVPEIGYANFQSMFDEIAKEYKRVTEREVEFLVTGMASLGQLQEEILFDVNTKAGQFDGYVINPVLLGEMASVGGLFDLTEITRSYSRNPNQWLDILPFYREILSTYDGKVLLTPLDGDVFSMFYRKDLFEKHGIAVPKTWQEYLDAAEYFHEKENEVMNPITNETRIEVLAGSCFGRVASCGGAYWAQNILGTMTQGLGPATGSLLDTDNFSPLLGEAMTETLYILEQQHRFGAPDEFDGCTNINFQAMNEGRCALTISWGNSFTQHNAEGSVVVGKLGVAKTPGSTKILNRETRKLEECTTKTCPHGFRHIDKNGNEVIVNDSPYAAYGGFSAAVSNNVNEDHKEVAADFILFASDTGQALKYVVPERNKENIPTGQDPWRFSLLNEDVWVSRGYPAAATKEYLETIKEELSGENVIADPRFPRASAVMDILDNETFLYLNNTALNDKLTKEEKEQERKAVSKRIGEQWMNVIATYDNDPATTTPLLEIYQRIRGVYVEPSSIYENGALSSSAIVGIVIACCVTVALIAFFLASWIIRKEREKRNQSSWFISPNSVKDTGEVLGKGSFGIVTKGFYRGSVVALKHPYQKGVSNADELHRTDDGGWHFDTLADATTIIPDIKKKKKHPLHQELMILVKLRHSNIVETLGATILDEKLVVIFQYMRNNTVRSILKDPKGIAGTGIYSLEVQWALQVARGLAFLHTTPPPSGPLLHNDLKSSNVLVDEAFNAHISDFGLATKTVKGLYGYLLEKKNKKLKGTLLWLAPEILNGGSTSCESDVYSFSMFLVELMTRNRPYNARAQSKKRNSTEITDDNLLKANGEVELERNSNSPTGRMSGTDFSFVDRSGTSTTAEVSASSHSQKLGSRRVSESILTNTDNSEVEMVGYVNGKEYKREEILAKVQDMSLDPPFRPDLPEDAPHFLRDICVESWHKNPKRRPTMTEIEQRLSAAVSNVSFTQQLIKRGSMFDSIVPRDVQEKLARGESVPPKTYENTSVIFSDIVGFTNLSAALTTEEVGDMIQRMISKFDTLCLDHDVKKLDVIGDAFLGVVGVPNEISNHATRAASFALDAIKAMQNTLICSQRPNLGYVRVRFGIASGPVVATVIGGMRHPKFTLFGDTVNVASRMESSGEPNRCQCTEATANLVSNESPGLIKVEERGLIEIKGKGKMNTFWLQY